MKKVERTYHGETQMYPIFTKEEADDQDIDYVYWKDATEEDSHAISDDDYVSVILGINGPYTDKRGRESSQIILPYCRRFNSPSSVINFEEYYGKGNYSGALPESWEEKEAKRKRTKRVIRLYAILLLQKGRVPEEDMQRLGKLYRPDQEKPSATFKRLLKNHKIKKMVQEQLTQMLTEKGITPEEIIQRYDDTYNKASKAGQHSVAKSVLDKFAEFLEIQPSKGKNGNQLPPGSDAELGLFLEQSEETFEVDENHDEELLHEVAPDPVQTVKENADG